ncbi:hypothetical protein CEXT_82711 [Caerostris extrusa]|uniref:Uncharacterized protein n=1 Tax=Caerostris extrusa TaxID=172846 RepID=A0AAV4P7K6_CAEEX|nr:hypothetical protein CEXT_82711 [Caerostris extrusa]
MSFSVENLQGNLLYAVRCWPRLDQRIRRMASLADGKVSGRAEKVCEEIDQVASARTERVLQRQDQTALYHGNCL